MLIKHEAVAVVTVNWNGQQDTLECLRSLAEDSYERKQIIVVDNGSTDGSAEAVQNQFPQITVIRTGENLGFTGGNNVGIRVALDSKADYVLLLNNDTIVGVDAVSCLVTAAKRLPEFGIFSPVIHHYEPADKVWFAGAVIDLEKGVAVHDNTKDPGVCDEVYEIPWASGCAMLVRRNLLEVVKGFDDRYFLYWEDVDLSLRARRAGARIAMVPSARIYHKIGKSCSGLSASTEYYYLRNNLLLADTHVDKGRRRAQYHIIRAAVWRCRFWPQRTERMIAAAKAVRDYIFGRYGRAESLL